MQNIMQNETLITYALIGLASKEVNSLGFIINDDIPPIVNLINIYYELKKRNLDYLWFNEFILKFNLDNKDEFIHQIGGGGKNLIHLPLGYDSTSHIAMFVCTMHYPGRMKQDVEVVDLRNKTTIEPITCYSLDAQMHLPYYPYDEKENDTMYNFIHQITMKKYKHIQDESNFGKDNFIPSKMREFTESCRIENARIKKIIDEADDNVEIKIEDRILIKGISVTDPQLIKSILKKEY